MRKRRTADAGYVVDGLISLNDLEEILPDMELPDTDIETLNGFLLYRLGRLPREGEQLRIEYGGYLFQPLSIQDKVIQSVKILPLDQTGNN